MCSATEPCRLAPTKMDATTAPLVDLIRAQGALRGQLEDRLITRLQEVVTAQGIKYGGLPLRELIHFPLPVELQRTHTKHGIRLSRLSRYTLTYELINRDGYGKGEHSLYLYNLSVGTLLQVLDYLETYGQRLGYKYPETPASSDVIELPVKK